MRKLNKNNKILITILSMFTFLVLASLIIFIVFKVKDYNIKYDVKAISYVYNNASELITVKNNTYVKKDLLGRYILFLDKEKINLGKSAVIYNSSINEIKLLGTFYEVTKNGETKKYTDETSFSGVSNRIFKISDRKYLVTGKQIKSEDSLLTAENYLLVNLDKVGNSYVYNNVINYKSFGTLNVICDLFTFKTNEEKVIFSGEEVDLAKISGSTNNYKDVKKDYLDNKNNTNKNDNIYDDDEDEVVFINKIHQTVKDNKYVTHKTTILSCIPTQKSITINYMVYDPLTEFTNVYVKEGDNTYDLGVGNTEYVINNLLPNTTYHLEFYYDFKDENGNVQSKKFDETNVTTLPVKGKITLEKVSANSVSYILKIDGLIDSAKANLYIDGNLVSVDDDLNLSLASTEGYKGSFNYSSTGSFATIVIENGVLQNSNMGVIASYKFKL